ncbi:MAG: hypothetical protein ACOCRK_05625 [bacterium]
MVKFCPKCNEDGKNLTLEEGDYETLIEYAGVGLPCQKCGYIPNKNEYDKEIYWKQESIWKVFKQIYDFTKERDWKYGINEKYIKGKHNSERLKQEALDSLFKGKPTLIFCKKSNGEKYWLPTKKGREVFEKY